MAIADESDNSLRTILVEARRVAIVGLSPRPERPSHQIAHYLIQWGYDVCGVNPVIAGQTVLGRPVYASLVALAEPPDIIDVFRRSVFLPAVVDDAIALRAGLESTKTQPDTASPGRELLWVIWTQFGIVHDPAAARARAAGFTVIQDRCVRVEHARLRVGAVGG